MRAPADGFSELNEQTSEVKGESDPADAFNIVWARELIAEALRRMEAECALSGRRSVGHFPGAGASPGI